jgi:hypothetical protein
MNWKKAVFFLSVICTFSNAYKIAIFTPDVSASQVHSFTVPHKLKSVLTKFLVNF